jgi:asparagine synthase (glutamine-hydrolysing)
MRLLHLLPLELRRLLSRVAHSALLGRRGYAPSSGLRGKLAWMLRLAPDPLQLYRLSRIVHLPPVVRRLVGDTDNGSSYDFPNSLIAAVQRRAERFNDVRSKVSVYERMLYLGNQLLRDTDAVSMAVSLEVRVPFLDHELTETVESLPPSIRFDKRTPKRLLIDAVRDLLPPEVYQRRKQGFELPIGRWLAGPLRRRVHPLLSDPVATAAAGLQHLATADVVADCVTAGERVYFTRLWSIYLLVDWCRRNAVSSESESIREWVTPAPAHAFV